MNNELLLNVFEQMASSNEYVNDVHRYRHYRNDLGISEREKGYIRRCVGFGVAGIGEALAKIISAFQKEEYEYLEFMGRTPIIKKEGTSLPKLENNFKSNNNYIVLAIGRNDYVSFYAFDEERYVAYCDDRLDYPFPYIKEFIDEVIKFRIKYGITEIADYGLDFLASEFIKAREDQLEVGSGARVRRKKSSQ